MVETICYHSDNNVISILTWAHKSLVCLHSICLLDNCSLQHSHHDIAPGLREQGRSDGRRKSNDGRASLFGTQPLRTNGISEIKGHRGPMHCMFDLHGSHEIKKNCLTSKTLDHYRILLRK